MIHSAAWLLIFPVLFVCAAILWYRAERNGSLQKRVLTGFLALVFSLTLTVLFAVSITQLDDQSYYAASVRTLLDETLEAFEAGEPGFGERLKAFRESQRLTYETRANLLENARRFAEEGSAIRARRKEENAPHAESPERMILNVSLSMHSVNFFNRLALEHPFFERRMTVKLLDAPMADLNDIIAEQAGISVHAIDGAGRKSISITAADRPLRSILLELAETHGFLYEPALSSEGDVIMLFMYNVYPMLRGLGDSQGPELEGDQGDSPL